MKNIKVPVELWKKLEQTATEQQVPAYKVIEGFTQEKNCFNCNKYSNQDECIIKLVNNFDASNFCCNEWIEKW